jgi:SAM-dependent methyltransferase
MRTRLLDFIECPFCRGQLRLLVEREHGPEIESGTLTCDECSRVFPIIRGIPRFLEEIRDERDLRATYADSFGHQWTTYDWLRREDELEFFQITDLSREHLAGKTVLDAGCGGGRFSRFVAEYCGEIVAIDYSIAVDKARELAAGRANAHFIQCDINRNPLKRASFDLVYSHGVLHHTPNTRRAFDQLTPLVKDDGLLYVAVFRKTFALLRWSDAFWRSALNKLPIRWLDRVCGGLSYLSYMPFASFWKRFFWFSVQRTHQIRKCCLYDWYGPTYHHEHTAEEVISWYRDSGFTEVRYINAWPYCPVNEKYAMPAFTDSFRIGQLLGVRGAQRGAARGQAAA